jgi:hypothetical protein
MKQVYQTRDGEVFEDHAKAKTHDDELFDVWLAQPAAQMVTVQDLIEGLDTCDEMEFFATPRAVFIDLLRGYFDGQEKCA